MQPSERVHAQIPISQEWIDHALGMCGGPLPPECKEHEIMSIFSQIMATIGVDTKESVSRFQHVLDSLGDAKEMWRDTIAIMTEDLLLNYANSAANRTIFFMGMTQAAFMIRQGAHEWKIKYAADGADEHADSLHEIDRHLLQPFAMYMAQGLASAVIEVKEQRASL